MIASFSSNFAFIRTRKTASTSTELVLGSWCTHGDVVTPVGVESEMVRKSIGGEPRNFSSDHELEWRYRLALQSGDRNLSQQIYSREIMKALHFTHHMTAVEAIERLGREWWDQAYTFAVDRHPYEKAISMAFWRAAGRGSQIGDWDEWIDQTVANGEYRNFDYYSHRGQLMVDHVFTLDNLTHEFTRLAQRWGKQLPTEIPREKSGHRRDRRPATEILTATQKRRIREVCAEEFELFAWGED